MAYHVEDVACFEESVVISVIDGCLWIEKNIIVVCCISKVLERIGLPTECFTFCFINIGLNLRKHSFSSRYSVAKGPM